MAPEWPGVVVFDPIYINKHCLHPDFNQNIVVGRVVEVYEFKAPREIFLNSVFINHLTISFKWVYLG